MTYSIIITIYFIVLLIQFVYYKSQVVGRIEFRHGSAH